jgi:hypothetical protein
MEFDPLVEDIVGLREGLDRVLGHSVAAWVALPLPGFVRRGPLRCDGCDKRVVYFLASLLVSRKDMR